MLLTLIYLLCSAADSFPLILIFWVCLIIFRHRLYQKVCKNKFGNINIVWLFKFQIKTATKSNILSILYIFNNIKSSNLNHFTYISLLVFGGELTIISLFNCCRKCVLNTSLWDHCWSSIHITTKLGAVLYSTWKKLWPYSWQQTDSRWTQMFTEQL